MNPPHQTKLDEGNDAARPAINRKAKAQQGHEARARHLGKWLLWRLMSSSAGLSVQRALHGHHRQQQHLLDPASSLQALERLLLVQLLLIGDALLVLACPRLLLLLRRISRTTRSPPLSLRCVHVPSIRELRPRVNLAQEACLFRVLLVLLHEELSRVLIERRLGEGVDQQASDDLGVHGWTARVRRRLDGVGQDTGHTLSAVPKRSPPEPSLERRAEPPVLSPRRSQPTGSDPHCPLARSLTCIMCPSAMSCFQSRLSVFTHTSPALEMFGWKIFVRK
mmetsp:Transcript_21513/g.57842  ORF Transcript_21513/g.57842 Transcript_21513/m.57842 type:complete len:279 (-) Transcript_21513:291-1127(-)